VRGQQASATFDGTSLFTGLNVGQAPRNGWVGMGYVTGVVVVYDVLSRDATVLCTYM
jgi:hypothetical protein